MVETFFYFIFGLNGRNIYQSYLIKHAKIYFFNKMIEYFNVDINSSDMDSV